MWVKAFWTELSVLVKLRKVWLAIKSLWVPTKLPAVVVPVTASEPSVPTLWRLLLMTLVPSVLAESTVVPLMR